MKQIRPLISGLVACSIALAMVTSVAAQSAQEGLAKVVYIKGSARYLTAGNTMWEPLKIGVILKPGAIVQTASGSYVDLVLNNAGAVESVKSISASAALSNVAAAPQPRTQQDAVRIFENTVLGIDKLTVNQTGIEPVTETQLDLKAGRILGTVKKLTAGSKYEVKIPNGVAGIRGTIYYIEAVGVCAFLQGSGVLAYMGPDKTALTQQIMTMQQFDTRNGQLTAISSTILQIMNEAIGQMQFGRYVPANIMAVDHTVFFVSDTYGQLSNGEVQPAPGAGIQVTRLGK